MSDTSYLVWGDTRCERVSAPGGELEFALGHRVAVVTGLLASPSLWSRNRAATGTLAAGRPGQLCARRRASVGRAGELWCIHGG